MTSLRKHLLTAITLIVVTVGLCSSLSAPPASAMTPAQTQLTPTINTLYWKLDAFWRWAMPTNYKSPLIGYFSASPTYVAACGSNLTHPQMMANCGNEIWIDTPVNQSKITRLGDYAAGYFLAHEWGHHMADAQRLYFPRVRGRELYADCMAGVFTRYGYSYGGFLDASDYWEGVNSLNDFYPYEGGAANGYPLKADRVAWYQWGFNTYSTVNCAQAVYQ